MGKKIKDIVFLFALSLITFFLYKEVVHYDFINCDDAVYVLHNIKIQNINLQNILWAFKTTYFGHWSPLLWISYMIDYKLSGGEPFSFHAHNLFIFIFCILLIYIFSKIIFKNSFKALFISLCFLLLALNVEPIAWVSSRKDLLSSFYSLLVLIFYFSFREKKQIGYFIFSLFFIGLGICVKPSCAFLVLYFPLIDYYYFLKEGKEINLRKVALYAIEFLPFLAFVAIISSFSFILQRDWGAIYNFNDLSFWRKTINASFYSIQYLKKIFFPYDLSIMYDHPQNSISMLEGVGYIFINFSLVLISFLFRKKSPLLFFSVLFFYIGIFPYLQFKQVGIQAYADRWVFLPKLGILFAIFSLNKKYLNYILLTIINIINIYYMIPYKKAWKNSISLYEHIIAKNDNARARKLYAKALKEQEEKENIDNKEKIILNLKESLKKDPLDVESFEMYQKEKKDSESEFEKEYIDSVFGILNDNIDVLKNKSIVLTGIFSKEIKDYVKERYGKHPLEFANEYLSDAMKKDKNNFELFYAYLRIANIIKIKNATVKTIMKFFPYSKRAKLLHVVNEFEKGNCDDILDDLYYLERHMPSQLGIYEMLATCIAKNKDIKKALKYINIPIKISKNASYINRKAKILLELGEVKRARRNLMRLIRSNKNDDETYKILSKIHLGKNNLEKALKYYSKVVETKLKIDDLENIIKIHQILGNKSSEDKYKKLLEKNKKEDKDDNQFIEHIKVVFDSFH